MSDMTYSQLDKILRELGFSVRAFDPHTNAYKHAGTGAMMLLPSRPERRVIPHHLVGTRMLLDGFGIPEPPELTAHLQVS